MIVFKEFDYFSSQQNKDTENIINCKYYITLMKFKVLIV